MHLLFYECRRHDMSVAYKITPKNILSAVGATFSIYIFFNFILIYLI